MFWFNPENNDFRNLEITHYNGIPLQFANQQDCFLHVAEHFDELKKYIENFHRNKATIGQITCIIKKD
mgnify:CR=1 FL=1